MSGLDAVLAIALVCVCAVPIGVAGAWFTTNGPAALAGFFRPASVTELGWPIGVQEEDAPMWNWDRAAPLALADEDLSPEGAVELVDLDAAARVPSEVVRTLPRHS